MTWKAAHIEWPYKHLVVSGCSFTSNLMVPDGSAWAWPNMLATWADTSIDNLAVPGAGNNHIARSIILHLERTRPDPATTLVMAMWTGIARIDWLTEQRLSQFGNEYPFEYHYNDHTELSLGGHWWNSKSTPIIKAVREYARFQDQHSFAVDTWLAMNQLANYLDCHGYQYYYTSYFDYSNTRDQDDAGSYNYTAALAHMELELSHLNWLPLAGVDHYGDWSKLNNKLADDNYHPGADANIAWTLDILAPCLKNLGAITTITKRIAQ